MNFDEINYRLADIANCGDPTFANAASYVAQIAKQAQDGSIQPEELKELLGDIQSQLNIIQEMSQLAMKEKLNSIINGLIILAAAV